jgi:hypothetical protein
MAIRRWVWVVVGIFAVLCVGCLGMVGAGAWFISRHVEVREMARPDIEREFAQIRARFKGQEPLLDRDGRRGISTDRLEARASSYQGPLPTKMCILAWERDDPRRVRICIPFWLLKFKTGKGMKLDIPEAGVERLEIDAEEIERAGPALLVDMTEKHQRVIVWTE